MKAVLKRKIWGIVLLVALQLAFGPRAFAQKDTVVMKKGDRMVGQLISLGHDILTLSTPYSTGLPLQWDNVVYLVSENRFKILDKRGNLYVGRVKIDTVNKKNVAIISEKDTIHIARVDIASIDYYANSKLTDRLKMNADFGFTSIKASKSFTLSLSLGAAYQAKRWQLAFDYFSYASVTDTIHNAKGNIGLTVAYVLPANWFLVGKATIFTSTEQNLDHRYNYFLGGGSYFFRNINGYLSFSLGGTYNDELFTGSTQSFKSSEAFGNLHFEYALLKDINVVTDATGFPSLTESGRFRSAVKTDLMINFSTHFRTSLGFMLNTDSKPPVSSSRSDYIINLKLGWKL
jgi:hypothetical protein